MFGFVRALAGEHAKNAIQKVTDAVVDLDPATASEAQLHMMEQALDHVGVELAKMKSEAAQEHAATVQVQQRFDRMRSAAGTLNSQFEAEADPTKKAGLEKSLNGLLTTLESIKSELDQHNQSTADADAMVAETESIYTEKGEALRTAKAALAAAARDLSSAHIAEERANEKAERAAEIAGLRDNKIDGLNAALTSMQRQTAQAKATADAQRMKADLLTHAEAGGLDDPNVKAALASVEASPSTQSFSDRLAALH
jgi:chromosome segregation ATPase